MRDQHCWMTLQCGMQRSDADIIRRRRRRRRDASAARLSVIFFGFFEGFSNWIRVFRGVVGDGAEDAP